MSDLMSFTSVFESVSVTSTTTGSGANVVYIVPANFDLELTYLTCTNGGSTQNINVQVYHADTTSYSYILRSHSVAGNDSYNILTSNRIFLHAGDKVLAYKGGGTFDVILSGKQYYNPVRTI
tara:strand:+ start:518 stop:883 length:366 start_codon:yes stop_codon:yes gene_type:complete